MILCLCVCVCVCVHMHDAVREDILREQQSANSDRSEPFVRLDIVQEEPDPPSLHASVGSKYHTKQF